MAITASIETMFGEKKDLYIRLNSIAASNHNQKTTALFRGFASKECFEKGSHYMYESSIDFDADISGNLWEQAYKAFCKENSINSELV